MAVTLGNAINQSSPVNWGNPLNRGLLAWWMVMPGTSSGSRFSDLVTPGPSGKHLVLVNMDNADWVGASRPGSWGALSFDGSNDYVEDIDAEDYINGLTAMSVSIWIKADSIGINNGFINGRIPNGQDIILSMRYDSAGSGGAVNLIKLVFGGTSDPTVSLLESSSNVQTTKWQHLLATWRADEVPTLYINGIPDVPTTTTADGSSISGFSTLRIGQGPKDTASSWPGLIDDVHIWNRVLPATEAKEVYQLSRQGYSDVLNQIPRRFVAAAAPANTRRYTLTTLGVG